jgi:inosine/xanthosine triphosphatase
MKILVGSKNPVKIDSVKEVFSQYFPDTEVVGLSVPSNVPDQPYNQHMFDGARNRALHLKSINETQNLNADFFVGIEGGIVALNDTNYCTGAMHIIDINGREGHGTCPLFTLPRSVHKELETGLELGDVTDKITGETNTKQKGGVINFLTKGTMNRKELYLPGLFSALIPFLNPELYFEL